MSRQGTCVAIPPEYPTHEPDLAERLQHRQQPLVRQNQRLRILAGDGRRLIQNAGRNQDAFLERVDRSAEIILRLFQLRLAFGSGIVKSLDFGFQILRFRLLLIE
jgi:hypothetical protein